jgi:hypothetical protein
MRVKVENWPLPAVRHLCADQVGNTEEEKNANVVFIEMTVYGKLVIYTTS